MFKFIASSQGITVSASGWTTLVLNKNQIAKLFKEDEKSRREDLDRIMEENQKKIEEQQRKMVRKNAMKYWFQIINDFFLGRGKTEDDWWTNEDWKWKAEIEEKGRESNEERAEGHSGKGQQQTQIGILF